MEIIINFSIVIVILFHCIGFMVVDVVIGRFRLRSCK